LSARRKPREEPGARTVSRTNAIKVGSSSKIRVANAEVLAMKRSSRQSKNWLDEYLPNDEPQGDLVDRANMVAEAFRLRSLYATLGLLQRSDKAKRRRTINRKCERCGKRIPKERLRIVPSTTRCVSCQRFFEQRRGLCTSFNRLF
jgi:phage/conjugal plasmid C-4 type zinc finger TraR family protein